MTLKLPLIILVCAALALSACASASDSSSAAEGSSVEVALEYNGQFGEAVFNRICSDITFGDKPVTFPFTLDELGEDFVLDKEFGEGDSGAFAATLVRGGKKLGSISYYAEKGVDIRKQKCIGFGAYHWNGAMGQEMNISFGGIGFESDASDITDLLGSPTEKTELSSGAQYIYRLSDTKYVSFDLNSDNKVIGLGIYMI